MPVAQPRNTAPLPSPLPAQGPAPRLATGGEDPVFSPVHALQQELLPLAQPASAQREPLYPLWLRIGIIGGSSAFAWALIIWSLLQLR